MRLDEIEQRFTEAEVAALAAFGEEVVADIRNEIAASAPPSSAPGSPPHKRTGDLQASLTSTVETFADAGPEVRIETTCPYGPLLERGTSRMEARPFLKPAREKWGQIWRETAKERIQQALSE